jgi:hypothetical protein
LEVSPDAQAVVHVDLARGLLAHTHFTHLSL